eukprot:gnl/MRDRNA2_/MRDRNA2_76133_c0_seq2.p1 gnl/MRDRNA2_/MRDRNA2_76133_c0~~gnl/MRDRNA2_/MRDRNA2_76133_c0_seq2.p1  ORF type:complete len:261 (+),score=48.64 gnl/MRDRNA2_/MRDRNA2_76133_c0_seq2:103-885(+)
MEEFETEIKTVKHSPIKSALSCPIGTRCFKQVHFTHGTPRGQPQQMKEHSKSVDDANGVRQALDDLYRGLEDGYDIPEEEKQAICSVGSSGMYGELESTSALWLVDELKLKPNDAFFDLGCGTGKLLLCAALASDVGCAVGLELSQTRCVVAREAVKRAGFDKRCIVIEDDFLTAPRLKDATVCYSCSTALSGEVLDKLTRRLGKLPRLRLFATLKEPSTDVIRAAFRKTGVLQVDTSWVRNTWLHLYEPLRLAAAGSAV